MSNPNQTTVSASASPVTSISIHDRFRASKDASNLRHPKVLHPLENEGLRLLILENISLDAVATFRAQGWHVDHYAKAMSEDELVEKIGSYHAIGIRSKTKITQRVLNAAAKVYLICIYTQTCVETNYVAPCYRMLLHRHQPGRSQGRRADGCPSLQFALLQLALCRRARHV